MNTAYLVLKNAHSLFGKNPGALGPEELQRVELVASKQFDLETRVLASIEARDVVVPEATLEAAMDEIRNRYPEANDFQDDLASNGLSIEDYRISLERELKVEAVLDKVGSRAAKVSDIDVELYYHYHPEQFQRPETRTARHILVTINEDLPDNTREAARGRIEAIAARLAREPKRFEEQAMKHSECPTALQGGLLGEVLQGQLYPELDAVLFGLEPMQLSSVVESPVGLHLVRCDSITHAGKLQLCQVRDAIRDLLAGRRKRICQSAWLKQGQRNVPESSTGQHSKAA
jgi:nitrogen fixation protein NifM